MRASLATRQVIVLSNERDFAADGVIALMRLAGVNIVRINSEDRPMVPDWSPSQHAPSQTAIWWRQFIPEAAPARSVLELDDRLVVGEQWRTWISIFDAPGTYWMAFDFASDDERIWFLEGNQAGEFSFLDRPLELGIGSAIANALAGSTLA
jgi:hypothetical protein